MTVEETKISIEEKASALVDEANAVGMDIVIITDTGETKRLMYAGKRRHIYNMLMHMLSVIYGELQKVRAKIDATAKLN